MSLRLPINGLRLFLFMALVCIQLPILNAQICVVDTSMLPKDTLDFSTELGACSVTSAQVLNNIGLDTCTNIRLIPSGPYKAGPTHSIYVYDEIEDEIKGSFQLQVNPASLDNISGVTVDPSGHIFIQIDLGAGKCSATKEMLLDQLNVINDGPIRSNIHFLNGTSQVTEFLIGDTLRIDSVTCADATFYKDVWLLFQPSVPTFTAPITINQGLTTCEVEIDEILSLIGYGTSECPVDRFEISDPGPFGYGQYLLDFIKLDSYPILKDVVLEITPNGNNVPFNCPNDTIPFGMLPEGKCALNEFDIIEKLGFTASGCGIEGVRIEPPGPYINSPAEITAVYVDGNLICPGDFTVTFERDTIDEAGSIICVQDLNITMGPDCMVALNADIILANGQYCYLNYVIDLWYTDDPSTIIASGHEVFITQPGMYSLKITNPATGNSCWSDFMVEDKFIEEIKCSPDTLWCYESILLIPDDTSGGGPDFPDLGPGISFTPTGQHNEYAVSLATPCGVALARYEDDLVDNCTEDDFKQIVDRTWTFEDNYGNSDTCIQRIFVRNTTIDSLKPFAPYEADCLADFALLDGSGNPSPEVTGYPMIQDNLNAGICGTLKMTYNDTEFPLCGLGKKIVREWVVIDWCSDQVEEVQQIIRIEDHQPPVLLDSLEDYTISADPFICGGSEILLPLPNYDDCNVDDVILEIIYETYTPDGQLIKKSNGSSIFIDQILSNDIESTFLIEYILTDPCGNESRDSIHLTIVDEEPPVAVCDQFTVISVGGNGNALVRAETFDDLSVDNCGILKFEARKLDGECDVTGIFRPDIRFCCDEVGDTILVEFRVTDLAGNTNICEVKVNVQDKFRPIINCPEDIRLDCGVDYEDLDITGRPDARDNCPDFEVFYVDDIQLNQCYQGTIRRTWMVRDKGDYTVSCVQIITIVEDSLFNMDQAMFPNDTTLIGCTASIEPTVTGKPVINTSSCAMVDATYSDLFFYEVENACVKILREWTVIDWCQREGPNNGIWKRDQIIKIISVVGPEFELDAIDTTFCINDSGCQTLVSFSGIAHDGDDCTPDDELLWSFELYNETDELITQQQGSLVERTLELGDYYAVFTAIDGCDNIGQDTFYFSVLDCTPPELSCPSVQPSLVLNPQGLATLSITDIVDFEVTDNCTSPSDIILSFAPDANKTELQFTCVDLIDGILDSYIKVYAADFSGNRDSCELFLQVRDNSNNICGGVPEDTLSISGMITTTELNEVEDVAVTLKHPDGERLLITDKGGQYVFNYLGAGKKYTIEFLKDTDHDDGVSTFDILMTQRHILALDKFDSPYQIIAADTDNSGNVSSIDLVHMRRIVLGLTDRFSGNGQKSWRFVDAHQKFENPGIPFPFIETITVDQLAGSMKHIDFMAVKIGDVNGSNSISSRLKSNARSGHTTLMAETKEDRIDFYADQDDLLSGMQLRFQHNDDFAIKHITGNVIPLTYQNYNISTEETIVSWTQANNGLSIKKGDLLFSVQLEKRINAEDIIQVIEIEKSEWIHPDLTIKSIRIDPVREVIIPPLTQNIKVSNYPNPFTDFTTIQFNLASHQELSMTLVDVNGTIVWTKKSTYRAGNHEVVLSPQQLNMPAGLYLLHIQTSAGSQIHKMSFVK